MYPVELHVLVFLTAIISSSLGGLILLFDWIKLGRRHPFLLHWGVGLLLVYWYSLPWLVTSQGLPMMGLGLNGLFVVGFVLTFLGLLLLTLGVTKLSPLPRQTLVVDSLAGWYLLFLISMVAYFTTPRLMQAVPLWTIMISFYAPVQLILSYSLWRWYKTRQHVDTAAGYMGLRLLCWAGVTQLGITVAYFVRLLYYPPELWFFALFNLPTVFIFQALTIVLLLVGGLLIRSEYYSHLSSAAPDVV